MSHTIENSNRNDQIVKEALFYVGQREEHGNSGFINGSFEIEMKEEGWQEGWAWCCLFAKVVFKNVYPERAAELNKLFSPSCVKTYQNARDGGYLINELPNVGNLVLWQSVKEGKPQATGHAGIVIKLKSTWEFESVEGNGSEKGSREGTTVVIQQRKVLKDVWNGLKVIGFVKI